MVFGVPFWGKFQCFGVSFLEVFGFGFGLNVEGLGFNFVVVF